MKTEFIRGKEVVRVENPHGNICSVYSADRTQRLKCALFTGDCYSLPEGPPREDKFDILIRPDQIIDYIAIKLVS